MPLSIEFDLEPVQLAIAEMVQATGHDLQAEFKTQARLLVEQIVALTPPGGGGRTPAQARKTGEAAVDADLIGPRGLFVGVRIKGRRKITTVFGRKLKRPIFVQTKLQPYGTDPRPIYDARKGKRFNPSYSLDAKSRGQKAAYYVDKAKLAALRTEQKAKVGKLASGWLPAIHAVLGKAAPWVERQLKRRGRATLSLDIDAPELDAAAEVSGDLRTDLERRVRSALEIRANAIRRQIPHILEAAAKKAKL